jgi:uncharacterized protein (DUF885 family)
MSSPKPMRTTRRNTLAMLAGGMAMPGAAGVRRSVPCPLAAPLDAVALRLMAFTPETACYAGLPEALDGGALARAMDDYSPDGEASLRAALRDARTGVGAIDCGEDGWRERQRRAALAMLENTTQSAGIPYGRINACSFTGHTPYLVTQVSGPLIDTPGVMAAQQSLRTARAIEAWLDKLDGFPRGFTGVVEKLRADEAAGCRPPHILIARATAAAETFLRIDPAHHPLVRALAERTAAAGIDRRLRAQAVARAERILRRRARPAMERLAQHLRGMATRDEAGVWAQPEGDALYAANVRWLGDTKLAPADIHRIGREEVARLTTLMDQRLRALGLGHGSVGARMAGLARDPAQLFADSDEGRAALIAHVRELVRRMEARYPEILPPDLIPGQPLAVRRVPVEKEAGAPGGYYDPPSLDRTGVGTYWINLRDMAAVPRFRLPTLSYHEGVPGHHTQVSVAQASADAPLLLRLAGFNAFQEGWALYAEALAAEMGVYADDPTGDLGRLQDELFRAARLIVDTGLHALRWTREQGIAELETITGIHPARATAEVERYMAWPGQALGYKLGQMRLSALRKAAQGARGRRLRLQAFHAAVLAQGPMPWALIEEAVLGVTPDRG